MNIKDEIGKLRTEISVTQSEIEWLHEAPISKEELKARTASVIRMLGERFEINRSLLGIAYAQADPNSLGDAFIVRSRVAILDGGAQARTAESGDIGPMLAWMFGDVLLTRLREQIDSLDYVAGPELVDRAPRLAELKKALRALEQREEALICRAENEGTFIPRRTDADPKVVLAYNPDGCDPRLGLLNIDRGSIVREESGGPTGTLSHAPPGPPLGPSDHGGSS